MYIKFFSEISKEDVSLVGGKAASLGEMVNTGVPVPLGFVITTRIDNKFAGANKMKIGKEIIKAFDKLNAERVAVRSSAIAEDSSFASWAGQLETYLNITRENLIEKVQDCWDSIKSERALSYAANQDLSEDQMKVAVVVQKMVESKASGVMFSVNPISEDCDEIMIEAGYGLGELLVQGLITPDNFIVNRKTLEIKSKDIQTQETMLVFKDGKNQEVSVPEDWKSEQSVSDEIVIRLAELAIRIENHYQKPQDIEWAIDNQDKIWILQSRPITTL